MRRHRVYAVRPSVPGDPDHQKPPLTPARVCAECGRHAYHTGRLRNGTYYVHGRPS